MLKVLIDTPTCCSRVCFVCIACVVCAMCVLCVCVCAGDGILNYDRTHKLDEGQRARVVAAHKKLWA